MWDRQNENILITFMFESAQKALRELRFEVLMRFPEGFLVQIRLVVGECK